MGNYKLNKVCCIFLLFLPLSGKLFAGELSIINQAKSYYSNIEYYSAITELLRYQYLYPNGQFYPESMLLMGKAYFNADNYHQANRILSKCYKQYSEQSGGEGSLYYLGYMRLYSGSPINALRTFQEYLYIYKKGKFSEEATLNQCYAAALTANIKDGLKDIENYRAEYPEGEYLEKANQLEKLIIEEINRPKKRAWISVMGSILIPGFGHFYTGKYKLGFLSFFSNAALIFLIFNGYKERNIFQVCFFSLIELSFYNYSLYSAIYNVREYNSRGNYYKQIRFYIDKEF